MTIEGKRQSIPLTEGPSRAAARSYLRGVGYSKEDLHKPIIGIANTWTEIGTCNMHLRELAEALKGAFARPAARRWSSTPSPSPMASRWVRRG